MNTMEAAISGSTIEAGQAEISPIIASASVTECAMVKEVIWISSGLSRGDSRNSPTTNRI
jgi:hypothetical protein